MTTTTTPSPHGLGRLAPLSPTVARRTASRPVSARRPSFKVARYLAREARALAGIAASLRLDAMPSPKAPTARQEA